MERFRNWKLRHRLGRLHQLALPCTLLLLGLNWLLPQLLARHFPGIWEDTTQFYWGMLAQELVLWLLPALLLGPRPSVYQRSRRLPLPAPGMALLCGISLQTGLIALRQILCVPEAGTSIPLPHGTGQILLAYAALAIAPAICEELFFRGALLAGLRDRCSPLTTFAVSTLVFALMHGNAAALPEHLTVGALCTLCVLRWGRIAPAILLHLGYNATAIFLSWFTVPDLAFLILCIPVLFCLCSLRDTDLKRTGHTPPGWMIASAAALLALEGIQYL